MIKEVLYYFEGLDESILKLNGYLTDDYFEFKSFPLGEFLNEFRSLIPKKEDEDHDYDDIIPVLGMPIEEAFGLDNSKYFTQSQILKDKHIIFLRYAELEEDDLTKIGRGIEASKSNDFRTEINYRVKKLIERLKLIKSGHIKIISEFEFTNDLGCVPISHSYPSKNKNYKKYFFDDDDVIEFGHLKKSLAKSPTYLNLAFESFFESYNIENEKLRFIILMICLESIFIISKKDITKTLSKNVPLVIIKNKKEFVRKKKRVEILYDLRSKILHGEEEHKFEEEDKLKNEIKKYKKRLKCISTYNLATEEIVRNVLRELILNSEYSEIETKKQLWYYLEDKGNNLGII